MKDKILKYAGKRGKSKIDLATKCNAGYSTISAAVNELVADGKLAVVGKEKKSGVGRPATLYGVAA